MNLTFSGNIVWLILTTGYFFLVGAVLFTIIKDKRDPVKSVSWIIVIITLPVFGFIMYLMFGRNFRKRKIFNRKLYETSTEHKRIVKRQLFEFSAFREIHKPEVSGNREIITLLLNNSKSPLTLNNEVAVLNDGEATFDAILRVLGKAEKFIHIEYYIVRDDEIGNRIADMLIEKAKSGVEVRFIYDPVGSWGLSKRYVSRLEEAGVRVAPFMPVIFPLFTSRINNRNHRKIIVVDGDIGFTGGINIADKYINGTPELGSWRDTHLLLRGEAVVSLHAVFATDWIFLTNERLTSNYFTLPEGFRYGDCAVQVCSSGPDSDWATIMQVFFSAITKARNHVYISTPYFLPNNSVLNAIKVAAMSGVDVRLMIPKNSDSKLVFWATCSYIGELLEAKVKIYLYEPGFNHSKIIMIDSVLGSVGTANMDVRSFEDNFEVSAMIYDRQIALELERKFLEDLKQCTMVTIKRWKSRKKKRNFLEGLARLFTPLL